MPPVILLLLLAGVAISEATPTMFSEDRDFSPVSLGESRIFVTLNSTYLAYGIAFGAAMVLIVGVGLYLYDYYYGTSRTDPVEGNYNQYYTDPEAYNQYLYQQAQYQSR